MRLEVSN